MNEKPSIFEIFAAVKREVAPVGKNSTNTQQNFKYRGVDAVVNAVAEALDKYGVIPVPILDRYDYDGNVEVGKNRSLMGHVKVEVTYRFYGPAGDYFDAKVPGEAMDSGDKATAKAMSVAYRIVLLQTLNLPTGDPDPDSQTYERSSRASSAGDAWDSAAPAPARQGSGDGAGQRRSREQRPAAQQPQAAETVSPDADEDAQAFADEAYQALTMATLEDIHRRAREAGKVNALVRNPTSGKTGKLALYLNWRRQQVKDLEDALTDLTAAASERGVADLDGWFKSAAGAEIDGATASQLRDAAKTLRGQKGAAA
jgi:hypothetical protein